MYAVSVPMDLDRRVATAITIAPAQSRRPRARAVAALAAAVLAIAAAAPAFEWFEGWDRPFDRLLELSTPVDQTVTADGYRVTVHRAYADRLGVRLALTVEDLEARWSELYVEAADVTDAQGRRYESWNWSGSRTPIDGSSEAWSRFLLPAVAPGEDLSLRVTVTSLAARAPEPVPTPVDPNRIWTSVSGEWNFNVEVPFTADSASASPIAEASEDGVTITLEELGVVPSGTVVRLGLAGLPEMPPGTRDGWYPVTAVEHDGKRLTDDPLPPGVVGSNGEVTLELVPVAADLAGHWKVTILGFHSFDLASSRSSEVEGPWVLEFDVADTP
jgi:hypothetical protein